MPFESIYTKKYGGRTYFYRRMVTYGECSVRKTKSYKHLGQATWEDFVRLGKPLTDTVLFQAYPGDRTCQGFVELMSLAVRFLDSFSSRSGDNGVHSAIEASGVLY